MKKSVMSMKEKLKTAAALFACFVKIGLFTFGGGYAMIPLIQKEISEKKKWIDDREILDVVAIAESTPGPIAINAATFVGFKVGGFLGAFVATVGVVLPSFVIIYAVSFVLRKFSDLKAVRYAFLGVRAGVLALIIKALVSMYKQCQKSAVGYVIMFSAFALAAFTDINVIFVIVGCAVVGLASSLIASRRVGQ